MAQEIIRETIADLNIRELALNKDFGRLNFKESLPFLEKTQSLFKELDELNYTENLSKEETNQINSKKDQFVNSLKQLQGFDIGQVNSQGVHDNLEQQFINFYNNVAREMRTSLVYLRQESALQSQDAQELQKQQKATVKAEQKYRELADKLEQRFKEFELKEKEVKEKKEQVEAGHAELAAIRLAKYFEEEVKRYENEAGKWLKIRNKFYWGILIGIIIVALVYFWVGWNKISLQLGIAKIIFLSALWYGLSFATRNYNIHSQLAAVNRHRSAVARTVEDFMSSKPQRQAEILKNAAEAMFKNAPIGFISRAEKEGSNPIHEIVNNFFGLKTGN